jgi:hypothetical protein
MQVLKSLCLWQLYYWQQIYWNFNINHSVCILLLPSDMYDNIKISYIGPIWYSGQVLVFLFVYCMAYIPFTCNISIYWYFIFFQYNIPLPSTDISLNFKLTYRNLWMSPEYFGKDT